MFRMLINRLRVLLSFQTQQAQLLIQELQVLLYLHALQEYRVIQELQNHKVIQILQLLQLLQLHLALLVQKVQKLLHHRGEPFGLVDDNMHSLFHGLRVGTAAGE